MMRFDLIIINFIIEVIIFNIEIFVERQMVQMFQKLVVSAPTHHIRRLQWWRTLAFKYLYLHVMFNIRIFVALPRFTWCFY